MIIVLNAKLLESRNNICSKLNINSNWYKFYKRSLNCGIAYKTIKNKNNTLKIWFVPFNFCYFASN